MNESPRLHLSSLAQLALSGLALVLTLPGAVILAVMGLGMEFSGLGGGDQSIVMLSLASMALLISLLLIPSAVLALFHLLNRQPPTWRIQRPLALATFLMVLWPVFVFLGYIGTRTPSLTWLLLPPIQVLAVGIPVWFIIELGRRGLQRHAQREWGVLSFGLVVNPILIILLELMILLVVLVLAGLWASTQPGLLDQLRSLVQQLRSSNMGPDQLIQTLQPLLSQPGVIALTFLLICVLMPMVEELFKPVLVWALAISGKITPAGGFTAGLISGGAFALIESLQLTSQVSDVSWAGVVFVRLGTLLLHITTAGLMGRAIAAAWTEHRYRQLFLTFLLAVGLHGLWNFFGVLVGVMELFPLAQGQPSGLARLSGIAPVALVVLALALLLILLNENRKLQPPPALPSAASPEPGDVSNIVEQNQGEDNKGTLGNGIH